MCFTPLHPPPPSMRSFSSFMSQRKARSKMKGYCTSQSPGPQNGERRRSLLQGPCCYSKHLPLWERSSSPIVVQKLVVLLLAPEACGRPPCCSGFRCVVRWMFGLDYHHHQPWPFALSPKARHSCLCSYPLSRAISNQHSCSFFPGSFVLFFFLRSICLLLFGAPSLYPWLDFKGVSL